MSEPARATIYLMNFKKIIIGLGNPGRQYAGTRHNLGIDLIVSWLGEGADWREEKKTSALVCEKDNAVCIFPLVGMNESGKVVAEFLKNKSVELPNVLVVHDELELSLGETRLVSGGSAKGHNGVRSVQEHLGTQDIPRLKLGIGRPEGQEVHDFVLSKFSPEEKQVLEGMFVRAGAVLDDFTREEN